MKKNKEMGFTLIETLLSIMLILLVSSIFISIFYVKKETSFAPIYPDTKINRDITNIENALKLFKYDNNFYPTTEQGLESLVIYPTLFPYPKNWVPYLDKLPLAPNGKPYQYSNPGIYEDVDLLIQNDHEESFTEILLPSILN